MNLPERLRFTRKLLVFTAIGMLLVSLAVCHFGIQSEISKIPPETRAVMDPDWVGARWAIGSVFIDVAALVLLGVATGIWIYERRSPATNQYQDN